MGDGLEPAFNLGLECHIAGGEGDLPRRQVDHDHQLETLRTGRWQVLPDGRSLTQRALDDQCFLGPQSSSALDEPRLQNSGYNPLR